MLTVYHNKEGMVLLELGGHALELTREEAEQIFVDIGHVLQDLDNKKKSENEAAIANAVKKLVKET